MEQPAIPKPIPRAQSSIRSFFQPRQPNYTHPPASANSSINGSNRITPTPTSPLHPSSPPTVEAEPQTGPPKPTSGTASLPQASILPIREKHIQQLKRINSLLLPINYPDSFYHKIVDPLNTPNFSRVILFHEPLTLKSVFFSTSEPKVVGGIVCRLEKDDGTRTSAIYIQSLALLSPYRSHGLATRVLDDIIEGAVNTPQIGYPVTSLYAHVWTENSEGLEWYAARGFTREEPVVQDYYRRLNPGNAWIMRRSLVPSDHLRHFLKPNEQVTSPDSPVTSPPTQSAANSAPVSSHSSRAQSPLPTTRLPPTPVARAASYQNTGPGHEWNDLPDDILAGTSKPHTPEPPARAASATHLMPNASVSANGSAASSRSSSRSGTKKKRQYPAAAFNGAGAVNGKESS
jgi:ribosomal protein S18 acetylase RimI-like enzyme